MPRTNAPTNSDDENINAPFRSVRRGARKRTASRGRAERRLTIRSEQREQPNVRKIARAIIAMGVVEAEREAQAQAQAEDADKRADATDASEASETADD